MISTVGQVVGHSLEDKWAILDAVKSCGYEHRIIAAFSAQRRVDDAFCGQYTKGARAANSPGDFMYAFCEDADEVAGGEMLFGPDHIPIGLQKMKQYGISHPIIEIDLADEAIDWEGRFPISKMKELLLFLLNWAKDNLPNDVGSPAKGHCFVNL